MNVEYIQKKEPIKSGFTEIMSGISERRNARANEQNANTQALEQQSLAASRPQELEAKRASLSLELAKMTQAQEKEHWDNGYKLLTDMSIKAGSLDPSMKKIWEQSDGYKEITKVVKKYLGPEFVNSDGTVNYIGKQTIAEDQLKQIEGQLTQRIQAVGLEGLTQQEKDLVKYFKNPGTEAIAKVYSAIQEDERFLTAQEAGDTAGMARIVQEYKSQIFRDDGLGGTPAPQVDPNDPLGWRKKSA